MFNIGDVIVNKANCDHRLTIVDFFIYREKGYFVSASHTSSSFRVDDTSYMLEYFIKEPVLNKGDNIKLDGVVYTIIEIIHHEGRFFYKIKRTDKTNIPNVSITKEFLVKDASIKHYMKV